MNEQPRPDIQQLLAIMAALRDPQTGCPWDIKQSFATIAPYTLEEACEVIDAIERQDYVELKDELGDLLLQVVFHARMAEEQQLFAFDDVVTAICSKLIRRHPHVFGDTQVASEAEVNANWERIKSEEKRARHQHPPSLLDEVPLALPALARAAKLQSRAARVGFEWPEVSGVIAKIREETTELEAELQAATVDHDKVAAELGDLLFVLANLARRLERCPEQLLRQANDKFCRRFAYIEQHAPQPLAEQGLATLDGFWQQAKQQGL